MKVINRKQRRVAFLKFFTLFLITSGLITVATFFNFKVPEKENIDLREKVDSQVKNEVAIQQFTQRVDSIKNILDSINSPGQNVMYLDQLISSQVVEMQNNLKSKDPTVENLHNNVTQLLLDLQASRKKVRDMSGIDQNVGQYKQQIESLKDQLERTRNELQICRQLQNMSVN